VARLIVRNSSISIDGFGEGLGKDLQNPLDVRGSELFDWFFHTRTFQRMHGSEEEGKTGLDDDIASRGFANAGAWILGRNMFGPVHETWPDETWNGWWGEEPPCHTPVLVLTHHPRSPWPCRAAQCFTSSRTGSRPRWLRPTKSPGGKDVRLGGGVATINPCVTDQGFTILPVLSAPGSRAAERADAPTLARRGAASPSLQHKRSASNTSTSQSLRRQHRKESHPPWTSDLCHRKAGPKVCTPRGGKAARRVPGLPP